MASKRVNVNYDADAHTMAFAPVVEGHESCVIALDDVFPGAIAALAKTKNGAVAVEQFLHGVRQKGGDVYSSKEKVPDNLVAKAVSAVFESIMGGNFSARGVGDGVGKSNDIIQALMQVTGKEKEACLKYYEGMDDAAKKDLANHGQIDLEVKKIRKARADVKLAAAETAAADAPEIIIG